MIPLIIISLLSLLDPSTQSGPSLSISPKILSKSGDPIRIQWSGVDSPSSLNWLGIYSPPDSPHDLFIGYVFLSFDPAHLSSGSGSVSLSLPNLRSNYSFRIFRWSESEVDRTRLDHDHNPLPGTKHYLGASEEAGFEPGRGPEQVHLAYTDREDEMRVMFVAEDGGRRYVRYGEREGEMGELTTARAGRYERLTRAIADRGRSPAEDGTGQPRTRRVRSSPAQI